MYWRYSIWREHKLVWTLAWRSWRLSTLVLVIWRGIFIWIRTFFNIDDWRCDGSLGFRMEKLLGFRYLILYKFCGLIQKLGYGLLLLWRSLWLFYNFLFTWWSLFNFLYFFHMWLLYLYDLWQWNWLLCRLTLKPFKCFLFSHFLQLSGELHVIFHLLYISLLFGFCWSHWLINLWLEVRNYWCLQLLRLWLHRLYRVLSCSL